MVEPGGTASDPRGRLWRVLKVDDEKVTLVNLRGWKRVEVGTGRRDGRLGFRDGERMTKTGDETVDSMFDEIKTVSMRTVNGNRFVADEETIREMEFAEACDALVAAGRRLGKIDRRAKAQVGVPDNLCDWFDALEARYQAEKRVWELFTAGDRCPRTGRMYLQFREALFAGKSIRAAA